MYFLKYFIVFIVDYEYMVLWCTTIKLEFMCGWKSYMDLLALEYLIRADCSWMFWFAGENVEPAEIEEAASRSDLINQIVVVGQVWDDLKNRDTYVLSLLLHLSL